MLALDFLPDRLLTASLATLRLLAHIALSEAGAESASIYGMANTAKNCPRRTLNLAVDELVYDLGIADIALLWNSTNPVHLFCPF